MIEIFISIHSNYFHDLGYNYYSFNAQSSFLAISTLQLSFVSSNIIEFVIASYPSNHANCTLHTLMSIS